MKALQRSVSFRDSLLFTGLIKAASFFKISFILGSCAAFFSATSIIVPMVGFFTGVSGSVVVCFLTLLVRYLVSGSFPFIFLAYHIPGFFAALSLATSSFLIRAAVPLVCIAAFVLHPVGSQAWVYSLYWLSPLVVYVMPNKSLFLQSLASTFIAHAVGSVIWVYANPMTPQMWTGLIPVVFVERMVIAAGLVLAIKIMSYTKHFCTYPIFLRMRRYFVA